MFVSFKSSYRILILFLVLIPLCFTYNCKPKKKSKDTGAQATTPPYGGAGGFGNDTGISSNNIIIESAKATGNTFRVQVNNRYNWQLQLDRIPEQLDPL